MKILVTGAAGKIGRRVVARFVREGWDVRASDCRFRRDRSSEFVVADLLRSESVYALVAGCEVVVHLGNHPHGYFGTPQRVYAENCAMNGNVFQAAKEHGVRRVIFASSIQAVATGVGADGQLRLPPYLPLDGQMPFCCGNTYGASKAAGEILLEGMVGAELLCGIAVRFPWVLTQPWKGSLCGQAAPWPNSQWPDGIALHGEDAADCLCALVRCEAQGFHRVLPARTRTDSGITAEEWRRCKCSGVPVKEGWELPLPTLVDTSELEALCGWKPTHALDDEFAE